MKKLLLVLLISCGALYTYAQSTIELLGAAGTGGPSGTGPVVTGQAVTFHSTAASAFSPSVTATYTLSNQQFTSIEGNTGSPGTQFGGGITTTVNSPVPGSNLYDLMNALSGSANANYTACSSCGVGTGIDITANRSIQLTNFSDALINTAGTQLQALNARVQYADLTITFNRPVSNPILQITGLGGQVSYSTTITGVTTNYDLGITTDLDLLTPGLTLSKISGNAALTVSTTSISNNVTRYGSATTPTAVHGITRNAATGSIVVQGTNITVISFRMYLKGDGGIVVDNLGNVVAASNGNIPRWGFHAGFVPGGSAGTLIGVSGDGFLIGLSLQQPVTVSGTIFNDPDAGNVNNSSGGANVIPTGMNANLVDANGKIVATVPVNADGTYSLPVIFEGNYTVSLSTIAGIQGSAKPIESVTSGWGNVGEFNGTPNTGTDASVNGISASFAVGATNVTNINFGIEKLPESAINLQPVIGNPGGFNSLAIPASAFQTNNVGAAPNTQDYDGGTVTNMRITSFPANANSITIGGVVYTNGGTCPPATSCIAWPALGVTIPYTSGTGPTQSISVDPIDGNVDVVVSFAAIDNAGKEDATPGSVTIPSRVVSLSGIVWNDADGNLMQNGSETVINGTNAGAGLLTGSILYANLIDPAGMVIATVPIQSNGTYTFANVPQSTPGLTVQINTNQGTIGSAKPSVAIPTDWVSTGENKNGQGGSADSNPDSEIPVTATTTNITLQNFAIDRLPNSQSFATAISQPTVHQFITLNGGTNPPIVSGSDPEDQPTSNVLTGKTMKITTLPTNAELYYDFGAGAVLLTNLNSTITNFDPNKFQLKITVATIGAINTSFEYAYVDLAGKPDPTPAIYQLTWARVLPIKLTSFTAVSNCQHALLNWEMSEQKNVSHYEVEFSINNKTFTKLSVVVVSSTQKANYDFMHVNTVIGQNYYRIKIVEKDGTISFSDVRSVFFGKDGVAVLIFPNPSANNKVNIALPGSLIGQPISIQVISMEGKWLSSKSISHAKKIEVLNIYDLASGTYIVSIATQTEVMNVKLEVIR